MNDERVEDVQVDRSFFKSSREGGEDCLGNACGDAKSDIEDNLECDNVEGRRYRG